MCLTIVIEYIAIVFETIVGDFGGPVKVRSARFRPDTRDKTTRNADGV